jgi:malonyl-CoA O-methyltransferase
MSDAPSYRTVRLSVAEAYDRWAEAYDSYPNSLVFTATEVVKRLAETVAGKAVVEFGCGTGRNLELLKVGGAASLAGLDLSPGMLSKASARDLGPALLLQHDMMQPAPLPEASADLVLFSLTLEHIERPATPLADARRLLKPGGRIAVVEIHPFLSLGGLAAHFIVDGEQVEMPTFPHQFEDHLNAFAQAGLTVTSCKEWRPRDLGPDTPERVFRRGADTPLVVEFGLAPA